jgi:cell division protein FtsI/penicillin-binding protein 2
VFAGFAPLNNPQLLAVSIIENGASGTSAGLCVRDVFDEWFGK